MSGPIPRKSLAEAQAHMGKMIDFLRAAGDGEALLLALSISEYLKDAERWAYVKEYIPHFHIGTSPAEVEAAVDRGLKTLAREL